MSQHSVLSIAKCFVFALAACGTPQAEASCPAGVEPAEPAYAVIRQSGDDFLVLDDATHSPDGIKIQSRLGVWGDEVTMILYFEKEYIEAPVCVVAADETLAQLGYTVGGSVGLKHVALRGSKSGQVINWNTEQWPVAANLFIQCTGGWSVCEGADGGLLKNGTYVGHPQ